MKLNETASIISPKYSPLFLQTTYRNILCYVFEHNNIPNKENALIWDPDPKKTKIFIELDENDNTEARGKCPSIIIASGGISINDQVAIGYSREGISFAEGLNKRHTYSMTNLVFHVDSHQREESKSLAYILMAILTTAHQQIRGEFKIHHIDPIHCGPTASINIGDMEYRTSLTFNVVMDFVWNEAKLDFPVREIVGKIQAEGVDREIIVK